MSDRLSALYACSWLWFDLQSVRVMVSSRIHIFQKEADKSAPTWRHQASQELLDSQSENFVYVNSLLGRAYFFKSIFLQWDHFDLTRNLLLTQLLWDRQFESRRFCEVFSAIISSLSSFEFFDDSSHSWWIQGTILFFFDQFSPHQTTSWSKSNKKLVSSRRMKTPSKDKSTLKRSYFC